MKGEAVERMTNQLLTESEVAERLRVSLPAVRAWRFYRRGPQFIKVQSLVRYRASDVEAWLESRTCRTDVGEAA